jgi:hypothetical protein
LGSRASNQRVERTADPAAAHLTGRFFESFKDLTMTALTVRLPNSVHQKIKELAARDEISVNQFIASAAAEKMASVMTLDYLKLMTDTIFGEFQLNQRTMKTSVKS